MSDLIQRHDRAYELARGCPIYAPGHPAPADATYHATRSGRTSAHCSNEWMMIYREMKTAGLKSDKYPHLFKEPRHD